MAPRLRHHSRPPRPPVHDTEAQARAKTLAPRPLSPVVLPDVAEYGGTEPCATIGRLPIAA